MINLLTTSEQRRLAFVERLTQGKKKLTLPELALELGCSARILQEDINYFQEHFTDMQVSTSNDGVQLTFAKGKNLEAIYQKILSDSPAYQLIEVAFLYEGTDRTELAELLSVSTATVYRLLSRINEATQVYNFSIKMNPLRVEGCEESIRHYYYQHFSEKYSYVNWQSKVIDEVAFEKLLQFFVQFSQFPVDFAFYNTFKLITSINLIRYQNNHLISTDESAFNFNELIPDLSPYADIFKDFEEKLNIKLTETFIHQVFSPYTHKGFSLSPERLFAKAKTDEKLAASIAYLDDILTSISEEMEIPLPNKEDIIFTLNNARYLKYRESQAGFVLYNRNKNFINGIRKNFPAFLDTVAQGIKKYRDFLGQPMHQEGLNFYIYTIFTSWENLVPELLKKYKQLRVIVISERHATHGHMIKDFIEYEFSEQFVVDIYSGTQLNRSILDDLDCDLIVTNFPVPLLETKETVYIENAPTLNDLEKLQKAINAIISKRLMSVV